jgi:hypothetical protein
VIALDRDRVQLVFLDRDECPLVTSALVLGFDWLARSSSHDRAPNISPCDIYKGGYIAAHPLLALEGGDVRMREPPKALGPIGGFAGGGLMWAAQQFHWEWPPWVAVLVAVVSGVCFIWTAIMVVEWFWHLFNDNRERRGNKRLIVNPNYVLVGLLSGAGALVIAAVIVYFAIGAVASSPPAVAEQKSRPHVEYLKNATLALGVDISQLPLVLGGTSAITTNRLRIFVDYSSHRSGWMARVRAPIGEIRDPVEGVFVRIQLIYRGTRPNGGTNDLWWGDNVNSHPVNMPEYNTVFPIAVTRGRAVIIGPSDGEQYVYFELVRGKETNPPQFMILQDRDVGDWIAQWEAAG